MEIYTIGHSRHTLQTFLALLRQHGIAVIVDVRSHPSSRHCPQYNAGALRCALPAQGIAYIHAPSLGGRPADDSLRAPDGLPDYARMAATEPFSAGLAGVLNMARGRRIALMCAEADPAHCHRERLLAPALRARGAVIRHILGDGSIAPEDAQRALELE